MEELRGFAPLQAMLFKTKPGAQGVVILMEMMKAF